MDDAEPDPIALVGVKILPDAGSKRVRHLAGERRAWGDGGHAIEQLLVIDIDELKAVSTALR